jgi:predicted Fe-Mo cluster-binding NifX family protein
MKIAVPVKENYEIDNHFGHCAFYQIYSVSNDGIINSVETTDSPEGCGCKSNLAEILKSKGVTLLIAGGIGNGAVNKLEENGINVIRNCSGKAADLVSEFLQGNLKDSGDNCSAHSHECNHDHEK